MGFDYLGFDLGFDFGFDLVLDLVFDLVLDIERDVDLERDLGLWPRTQLSGNIRVGWKNGLCKYAAV